MAMIAEPDPKMGANKLLPMRMRRPETGLYEINAFLLGSMWSVALVSATMRLVWVRPYFAGATEVEWAGGLSRSARTSLGRWTVLGALLSMCEDVRRQLEGDAGSSNSAVAWKACG